MMLGLKWLSENDFRIDIAGRTRWGEAEDELRMGFASFFKTHGVSIDAFDRRQLVLFPEMEPAEDVPTRHPYAREEGNP